MSSNTRKKYSASQGIVASADLGSIPSREIFFSVDPATLDYFDSEVVKNAFSSYHFIDFDPASFLQYLSDLESEIFWLLYVKKKNQKDVALLLKVSQPTVSYRYRRILVKLSYLMVLSGIDVDKVLGGIDFLKERERSILKELLFSVNQERVGKIFGLRQSSIKWCFVKTLNKLKDLERKDPEKWGLQLAMLLLLDRNLGIRVLQ